MLKATLVLCVLSGLSTLLLNAPAFAITQETSLRSFLTDKNGDQIKQGIKVLRPELFTDNLKAQSKFGIQSPTSRDMLTGEVRMIFSPNAKRVRHHRNPEAFTKDLVNAASDFLKKYPTNFSKSGYQIKLNHDTIHLSRNDQFLRFDIYYQGLRVQDAHIDFRFKKGQLSQVQNLSYIDADTSIETNFNRTDLATKFEVEQNVKLTYISDFYRVIEDNASYRFIRVAEFSFETDEVPYLVQLNYEDNSVFQIYSTNFYIQGRATATVYPRSWLDEAVLMPIPFATITVNGLSVKTDANGDFSSNQNTVPFIHGAFGTLNRVMLQSGSYFKVNGVADESGKYEINYKANPAVAKHTDSNMAQLMIYSSVNRIIERAKQYIAPAWFNTRLTAYANTQRTCNAFWQSGTINFFVAGGQCANTGLVGDVVYHEWGHGLDANTGGILDGAFSEGFGDIMALVMTGSPHMAPGFYTNRPYLRELETNKIYPRDSNQEIHAEGLIIGSTFYDLQTALIEKWGDQAGKELIAKYAFKMIYTAKKYTEVYNALLTIDDDDANISNLTPNFCVLNKVFTQHGLAKQSAQCPS